jgi:hypothetical protein
MSPIPSPRADHPHVHWRYRAVNGEGDVLLDLEIEASTESQALFAGIVQYATRVAAGTTPPTFARDWVIARQSQSWRSDA